jgi:O-antigen/teichoic acid export membrane protein
VSLRRQVFKGALALAAGRALGELCSFARNIIVARLLTPADVGIGATFWITVALLQMISDLASDRLLIQAKDGDEPRFQDTLHLWEFGRGLLNSLLLFGLAWPVAHLFKTPQALWAFQCIALVPLLRGLCHLDVRRFHRRLRYGPGVNIELVAQVVALALAYPLCRWRGDYSAVLVLELLREAIRTVGSYLLAERRYRWAWSGPHLRRLLAFGWPLLANGLLLFAIMQGDRLIVGTAFSTHDLGIYAMAFVLASAPFQLLVSVFSPIALPLLAAVQDQPAAFERRVRLCNAVHALAAGVVGIPLLLSAPWLLERVYGPQYAAAGSVFAWLIVARLLWFLRHPPTTAAMARADTKNALFANVLRSSGVTLAIAAAALRYPLVTIALAAVVGEYAALLASAVRLCRRHAVPVSATLVPLSIVAAALGAAGLLQAGGLAPPAPSTIGLTAALIALYCGALVLAAPSLRAELHRAASRARSRAGGVLIRLGVSRT